MNTTVLDLAYEVSEIYDAESPAGVLAAAVIDNHNHDYATLIGEVVELYDDDSPAMRLADALMA